MNSPARFRKRPVEVQAIQWEGTNTEAVKAFVGPRQRSGTATPIPVADDGEQGFVTSAEVTGATVGDAVVYDRFHGWVPLSIGDWIIQGLAGEFYPHAEAVFEHAYDPVTDVRPLP